MGSKSNSSKSTRSKSVYGSGTSFRQGHIADDYTGHPTVQRDSHGRIERSRAERDAFMRQQHPHRLINRWVLRFTGT
jgi:hypothetical protein